MGKRGPAPQGEYAGKSQVLSTRIRPDTRAALQEASKKSGRSLSQEIEHRLRRTFIEDKKEVADIWGSRQNLTIMRMVALAMQLQWNPFSNHTFERWLDDPVLFDQAVKTVNKVLEAIRPEGPIRGSSITTPEGVVHASDPIGMATVDYLSHQVAAGLWKRIQDADPSLPLNEGTWRDHMDGMMKTELGDVANRSSISVLSRDEFKQMMFKARKPKAPSKRRKKGDKQP
jgi:hypothetical protein